MPWGAAIAAGAGIVSGIIASKKAKRARKSEDAFRERELDNADRDFAFNKGIYDKHEARFDPVFNKMMEQIDDVNPDYAAIAGDVNSAFDSAQGMEERSMRRYGIRPTDGAARASQREYGIRRGATHVGARSAARQGAKDKRYGRYADLYNTGSGISSSNASAVSNAAAAQQGAFRDRANAYGDRASMYDQQGQDNAAGWGAIIGGIDWSGAWSKAKGANTGNGRGYSWSGGPPQ